MKQLSILFFTTLVLMQTLNVPKNLCYANQRQTARTTANINLRKSPGLYGEIIGNILEGETVVINNKHEDWYQVTYDTDVFGYKGWVYGKFIALNTSPPKKSEVNGIAADAMNSEKMQEKKTPPTPNKGDATIAEPRSQTVSSSPNIPAQTPVSINANALPAHIRSARIEPENKVENISYEDLKDVLLEIKKRKAELAGHRQTTNSKNHLGSGVSSNINTEGKNIPDNSAAFTSLSAKIIVSIFTLLILVVLTVSIIALSVVLKSHRILNSLYSDIVHMARTSTQYPEKDHEKRFHTRIISLFEVDFVVQGRAYWGIIHDISASGAFIETRENFTIGQRLTMTYKSPGNENPVKMKGVIIRVTPKGFGVKFIPTHQ